jgi:hypothetical protein
MPQEAKSWADNEVLERWTHLLYTALLAVQQWRTNTLDNPTDYETLKSLIEKYRNRLGDLGWFMKCLNEPIVRQANKQDGCTGHFWESRYRSLNRQGRLFGVKKAIPEYGLRRSESYSCQYVQHT